MCALLNPATNPPRLHGDPIGSAVFKSRVEDFQVEEVLGFEPSGEGEHCLLWIEKVNQNTNDVATGLAKRLGVRKRLISHCGLKDKNAITRQWFSVHLPGVDSPSRSDVESEGVRVLKVTRNSRKLRRGSHDANRFLVRLRETDFSKSEADARWQTIVERGVPNYFGPQRFGKQGGNVVQAIRFLAGDLKLKDRQLRGILISAARSLVFNACVSARVQADNWDVTLDGEVFGFPDNRSVVLPGSLRGDEAARVARGELELTAPLWGNGELQSENAVRTLEQSVADQFLEVTHGLAQFNLKQERRVMRLKPSNSNLVWEEDGSLVLKFDLPKGTYATTLIRELVFTN